MLQPSHHATWTSVTGARGLPFRSTQGRTWQTQLGTPWVLFAVVDDAVAIEEIERGNSMPRESVSQVPLISDSVYLLTPRHMRPHRRRRCQVPQGCSSGAGPPAVKAVDWGWVSAGWQRVAFAPISKSAQFGHLDSARPRVYKRSLLAALGAQAFQRRKAILRRP